MVEQFVWVEKYRPQTIDDCILPDRMKQELMAAINNSDLTHLIFTGSPGTGKTTVAKAIGRHLNADVMLINGSDENGIDVLRNKVRGFASALSLDGQRKVVILDEADYLNQQSTQPALRGFMEEFARTTTFILTCNYINRIIPALHSRGSVIEFKFASKERPALAGAFFKRCQDILAKEDVNYDVKVLKEVILKFSEPQLDYRRILNELQHYSGSGKLSESILRSVSDADTDELFGYLKAKDFTSMRKWVALHDDADASAFFRMLTEQIIKKVDDNALPEIIISLGLYNQQHGMAADAQLNMIACLTEIMFTAKWK